MLQYRVTGVFIDLLVGEDQYRTNVDDCSGGYETGCEDPAT